LEARKKKMQFDMKHKKEKKDPGSPDGEINLVSPELTLASKAVRGELRGIKREMFFHELSKIFDFGIQYES
jgi:hypothetical protein